MREGKRRTSSPLGCASRPVDFVVTGTERR
jgi:hypothetical protein